MCNILCNMQYTELPCYIVTAHTINFLERDEASELSNVLRGGLKLEEDAAIHVGIL